MAGKTTLQRLIDDKLAQTEGPPTAVDICDACNSDYAWAAGEVYRRTNERISRSTLLNWHRAAQTPDEGQ